MIIVFVVIDAWYNTAHAIHARIVAALRADTGFAARRLRHRQRTAIIAWHTAAGSATYCRRRRSGAYRPASADADNDPGAGVARPRAALACDRRL